VGRAIIRTIVLICVSVLAGWAVSTGAAWALQGSSCSTCSDDLVPTTSTTAGAAVVTPPVTTGRPVSVERPIPPASGTLPFTGGDVLGLAVLGAGAGTAGLLLLRSIRQPGADDA
jgi:hypothetical protein